MSRIVSLSRSQFAESFLWLNGRKLSLDYYPHMRQIYDSEARESVLMFSRQCVYDNQRIDLADGSYKIAKDLKIGDLIIGFNTETNKNALDKIKDIWDNGIQPVYLIGTETGRTAYVTNNHPFRKEKSWCEAQNLAKGDLITVSKENSVNSDTYLDKVVIVKYVGNLPTTGIEIEKTHTFQIDRLITANTSKSTSIANIMITNSAMIPGYKSLYVSPTVDQTKIFSHDRVTPVIESSPFIKTYFTNSSLVQNVFMKQFLNGSSLYLRYALLTADRLRGMSTDHNLFDEVQDMRLDLIPIIQESMSRSMYKRTLYSGTPKRTQGTLASLWKRSNKGEYVIKCVSCNFWNILGESNIGPIGPICTKCGRHLDIKIGQWVSTYSLSQEPDLQGYRVCLLHFSGAPWVDWKRDVLEKQRHFSRAYFANEVLALEHDEGASPVTMDDIRACCDPNLVMTEEPSALDRSYTNVMGIDYGPINSENSYTVIVCLQLRGDVVHVVYAKRFMGKEADFSFIHSEVPRLMGKWNCSQLAADYGMGEASNSEIRSKVGFQQVIAFQHLHAQKEKIKWNPKMPAYTLNRNQILGEFFTRVKKKKILFPRFEDFETFAVDMMNVQMKFDEERNSMSYINIGADDFVHAATYALTALELFHGIGGI
jgi:intein/homing endonuclease